MNNIFEKLRKTDFLGTILYILFVFLHSIYVCRYVIFDTVLYMLQLRSSSPKKCSTARVAAAFSSGTEHD